MLTMHVLCRLSYVGSRVKHPFAGVVISQSARLENAKPHPPQFNFSFCLRRTNCQAKFVTEFPKIS